MRVRPVVACAIAGVLLCGCTPQTVPPSPRADVVLPAETETIRAVVPRHATLDSLLRQHNLSAHLVTAAVRSAARVFNPRLLRADRPYRLVRSLDGFLREFEYQIDADRCLRIVSPDLSRPDRLDAEVLPYTKQTSVHAIRGRIDAEHSSLVAAMDGTGENIQLAMALAEVFAGQIDFDSDLQPGDTFEVLFEKSMRDGQFAGYGAILGARFSADGREHQAFRWDDRSSGRPSYHDENGRSLKRFFLRSPLRFEPRVTSGFSRSRLHPVYRTFRAHLGVDYGAPHGAAVVSIANGVIVSAGWAGGGGRQVRIRHASGYESYYLHLSSFGKGIRAGARVDQGQIIGRVGSTGTATGPHLDYRLRRNGAFVNPLAEHRRLPPGEPIPSTRLAAFRSERDGVLGRLASALLVEAPRPTPDAVKALQ